MISFKQVSSEEGLSDMIFRVYETKLDVDGGWGYTRDDATIIKSIPASKEQIQFNLAYMRIYLEMNILQPKDRRYSGIDIIEKERIMESGVEKVLYTATAIPEKQYNAFIDEYKEGYGKDDFDLGGHFARRKNATLTREIIYWYDTSKV